MGLVNMLLLMLILRHKIGGMRGHSIFKSLLKSGLASIVMGAGILLFIKLLNPYSKHLSGHLEAAAQIVIGMAIGAIIYLLLAWLLKMEELNMLVQQIKKRLHITTA